MDQPVKRRDAPTISQVAQSAGVSRSSVSRAFSKPEMLGTKTVERILSVARDLGYAPNLTARALSTGRYANVALIVPDVANPFFPPLIKAAQFQAEESDFCIFLGNSNESAVRENKLIERFVGQVEGMMLVSSRMSEKRIRQHASRCPVVLVNRDVKGIPRVLIDSAEAVVDAVAHLASLGHQRVLYISGPKQSWSNRQRQNAVRRATSDLGLEMVTQHASVPNHEAGRRLGMTAARTGERAIIAFDDLIAQGVMAGVVEAGMEVPGDVSVVGCDDVLASATHPRLTTVSNRSAEAGRVAMSILFELLNGVADKDTRIVLDAHLVHRETVGPNRRLETMTHPWS